MRKNRNKNIITGFTLIELLVVIAILAVLMVAVALILNPAELIKQGRDATRLSDLAAVHSAVALYLADISIPEFTNSTRCTADGSPPSGSSCTVVTTSTAVDGSGWVNIDFTGISSGSPLSRLPLDPINNSDWFYAYKGNENGDYEIITKMESIRYSYNDGEPGGSDVESTDGGDDDDWYEIGTAPGLDLW
jgi:prepilin-type N-terminal cleavage/methylation domain-containing protein